MISAWILISLIVAAVVVALCVVFMALSSSGRDRGRHKGAVAVAVVCLLGMVAAPVLLFTQPRSNMVRKGQLPQQPLPSPSELVPELPRTPRPAPAHTDRYEPSGPIPSPLELFPEPSRRQRPPLARADRCDIKEDQENDGASATVERGEDGEGGHAIVSASGAAGTSAVATSHEPLAGEQIVETQRTTFWQQRTSNNALYLFRIGGLCLLLLLAYLFLDAGRQRRFPWLRRISILATFVLVCVVLWRVGTM